MGGAGDVDRDRLGCGVRRCGRGGGRRARFASCSAAAIFLLMSMCSMWVLSTSAGEASLMMPGVAVGFAAATFVCTLALAPRSASKSDTSHALWIPR
ncbi:hypothetical protein [Rhodococcus sp. W8901]|uniref:hypothetical protein n=1 Tax=Rhodococcus sp. W8901 TaxID=2742603 RepID=UPI0015821CC3|nr:hypothetical protein [Rhodococcus sp. W8901]QKT11934.1 hypothetical protein HUN07_15515 [Rhodococcus sp. W8901]